MDRTRLAIAVSLTAGLAFLPSCNFPGPPSPQQLALTSVAETVSAQLTQVGLATPFAPSTNTPPPPATETPTSSPQPTVTAGCDDSSEFVSDVTIPDNMRIAPGQSFTKTWRLRNSGACDWTSSFAAVFVDGSSMGGITVVPLARLVPSNTTVDISIQLTAPTTNGVHRGSYRLRNASDVPFGTLTYVQILVGPTPTPPAEVYREGKLTIDNGSSIDFDGGTSTAGSHGDVRVDSVSESERYLQPTNGALLRKMSDRPSYGDCEATSLDGGPVGFTDFSEESFFCYRTSGGRYGRFEVGTIEGDSIAFDFRTWD